MRNAAPLNPLEYPWASATHAGLLDEHEFHRLDVRTDSPIGSSTVGGRHTLDEHLATAGAAPMSERHLVVAVGSNASPDVMRRKLWSYGQGAQILLPFIPGVARGLRVGHAALCTVRGYVPASPVADPKATTVLWASWFDDVQMAALDSTEPNYTRILVTQDDHPFTLANGEAPTNYFLYEALRGLLHVDGEPLPLMTQPQIFQHLAGRGGAGTVFAGEPVAALHKLVDEGAQTGLAAWFTRPGFSVSSGIRAARSSTLVASR